MNDEDLSHLIRETNREPGFPSSFHRKVWDRIAVAEQSSWAGRWRRSCRTFLGWMSQPAPAAATVGAMVMLGFGLGLLTAPDVPVSAGREAYLVSINPVAAAHAEIQE